MVLAAIDLKPYVVIGLALGGLFAVSGIGIVVVFRTTGVVNLAYGAIGALGALVAWQLSAGDGLPAGVGYGACVLAAGIVSLAYGLLVAPFLARRDPVVKALGTLGVALALLGAMSWIWGADAHTLTLPTTATSFRIFGAYVNVTQVIAVVLSLVVTALTAVFLRISRTGVAMRALADDREVAATLGLPIRRIEAVAWFGSGLLCGVTALLLADTYGLDYVGLTFLVISSLAAALIGRLQSLWVVLGAGMTIGVVESCLTAYPSTSQYSGITPFALAIAALLWLGRKRVVRVATSLRLPAAPVRTGASSADVRSGGFVVFGILATAIVVPALLSDYWLQVATSVIIYSVVALAASLLVGRVGLVSLCQVALLALGGWVALRLGYGTRLPFPFVIIAAGLVTAVIGGIVVLPALRLSGLYFSLITLMAAGAMTVLLTNFNFPNGGHGFFGYSATGLSTAPLRAPAIATSTHSFFRYALIAAAILFGLAILHQRGKPGRAWAAIRQGEQTAIAAGIPVTKYKLWAFALAAFITGTAGGLLAASGGGLTVYQFPTQDSLSLLAVVMIGGCYSVWGAVVAGLLAQLLPALLSNWGLNPDLIVVVFGIGIVMTLVSMPGGIAGEIGRAGFSLQRRLKEKRQTAPRTIQDSTT